MSCSKTRSAIERTCIALVATLWLVALPGLAAAQWRGSVSKMDGDLRDSEVESGPLRMRFAPEREDAPRYQVQRVDPRTLVVYRARTGQPGLEGFLLDVPALLDTLHARVLGGRGLSDVAQIAMLPEGGARPYRDEGAYRFPYHFSEPFGAVHAELLLAPLDDTGERRLLMALACSLALAIVLGLYALYRMSAVQMHFAERRENFVSAVSHELKTPLTAIRMYGEILREGLVDSDEKRVEYYGLISAESERLSRLVQNVLDLSRLSRGEAVSDWVVGDVEKVVREVVQVVTPQARERGFTLELEVQGALPRARFSADALKQVLFNLLDNALKYARESTERRITVCCAPCARGVSISVRDRGPGVPTRDLTRIFEAFYRGERELTRKHEGVGLGLSLVHRLVQSMGGKVEAQAAEPGLCVRVELTRA